MRHRLALAVTGMLSVLLTGCWMFAQPKRGKLIESWESIGKSLKFRVEEYGETNTYVAGAYYDFRYTLVGSENWSTIMTFRHDDPVPIPRKNVRFVNDQIAYVFMGWKYAITTDSGKTWSLWNAETDLPGWRCCNYELIGDIDIRPNGSGKMTTNQILGRSGELPVLHTTDFGRHWIP